MIQWQVIFPLVVFLIAIFGIGIWANKQVRTSDSFLQKRFVFRGHESDKYKLIPNIKVNNINVMFFNKIYL